MNHPISSLCVFGYHQLAPQHKDMLLPIGRRTDVVVVVDNISSERSIIAVDDDNKNCFHKSSKGKSHRPTVERQVHFNETLNQVHASPYENEEIVLRGEGLWYSQDDCQRFKDDTITTIKHLLSQKGSADFQLFQNLFASYRRACAAKTPTGARAMFRRNRSTSTTPEWQSLNAMYVGLEDCLYQSMHSRRKDIYNRIQHLQSRVDTDGDCNDPTLLQERIQKESQTLSYPACLFAQHIGRLTAAPEHNNHNP